MSLDKEQLGPAETIIQTLLQYQDHMYHGRPGVVLPDITAPIAVKWVPVVSKKEGDVSTVFQVSKVGKQIQKQILGTMNGDGRVLRDRREIGIYRESGIFPEVATWMYEQIAKVWQLDNEFAARWASYAFKQEHRDLKIVLAAFHLVQTRKGAPIKENGEVLFFDEDYRNVGEAMILCQEKGRDFNPKMLLRIYEVLRLPTIAKINHDLGFGSSAKNPFLGRWARAVEKWLRFREENPRVLEGLVKAGFRTSVMDLARRIGYKPMTDNFFQILRWKQKQSSDGRRDMALGLKIKDAESWQKLSEKQICQRIVQEKPSWKKIVGLLPASVGVTRAILAAALQSESLSDKDIVILAPTFEELGLFNVQTIKNRFDVALSRAEDQRAVNIAKNMRSKSLKDALENAADQVAKKVVEEVARDLRVYVMVDISGSMERALDEAKPMVAQLIQAFPLENIHVSVFNTVGREIIIKNASTRGVENAFQGIRAGGGTSYGAGLLPLNKYRPKPNEDALFIFIGDEDATIFSDIVRRSELNPIAFGFLRVGMGNGVAVRQTATLLGIPCFMIDPQIFRDPYAVPRTLRNLIAATPVTQKAQSTRVSLVETILQTPILTKPHWA